MEFKVIVTINETNAAQYNALFAKAYQALAKKGWIKQGTENSEGRFSSLNHYLAHAKELFQIDPAYLLLPLDEPGFSINANNRTISASKIVVLQNDNFAETVQFTIDRYFDQVDLNEARIFVQWTLPDGTEGATWADDMKDLSIPGKIRFGWTLTSDVTAQPGVVKFSVRFWNRAMDMTDGLEKVVYSFNTLTSSLTISPALQPEVNNETFIVSPKGSGLFEKAIWNAQIDSDQPLPASPHYGAPGLNLPMSATLTDNTLTLMAQAIVGDTGTIEYEWYYTPAVNTPLLVNGEEYVYSSEIAYPYNDIKDSDGKVVLPGFKHFNGVVDDEQYKYQIFDYKAAGKLNFGDVYYTKNGDDYIIYGHSTVPESGDLYERYTSYTVPEGDAKVTGVYMVKATNKIGAKKSNAQPSFPCTLIGPEHIELTKDLAASQFIGQGGVDLGIAIKAQSNKNTVIEYEWSKGTDSNVIDEIIEDGISESYIVASPGWYKVSAKATLNRETKVTDSAVCKVTFPPQLPSLDYDSETKELITDMGLPLFTNSVVNLKVNVGSIIPEEYEGYAEELFSEGLSYYWTKQMVDGPSSRVTEEDVKNGLINGQINTSELIVNNPSNNPIPYVFTCYVMNTLNGKTIGGNDGDPSLSFLIM